MAEVELASTQAPARPLANMPSATSWPPMDRHQSASGSWIPVVAAPRRRPQGLAESSPCSGCRWMDEAIGRIRRRGIGAEPRPGRCALAPAAPAPANPPPALTICSTAKAAGRSHLARGQGEPPRGIDPRHHCAEQVHRRPGHQGKDTTGGEAITASRPSFTSVLTRPPAARSPTCPQPARPARPRSPRRGGSPPAAALGYNCSTGGRPEHSSVVC